MSADPHPWTTLARAALEQSMRGAAQCFPQPGADGATSIHELRKDLKRAASLGRLFAPIVGLPAYAALDVVDAARRHVGNARDLDVLPGVLASLKCPIETRDVLMRAIAVERGKSRGEHSGEQVAQFVQALEEGAGRVAQWALAEENDSALLRSLRATYRTGKRGGRRAFSGSDADDLHDLRSRVIDLFHQCEIFEPAWPAMISAQMSELHRLRGSLGDHNDLTVLGEFALSRRELPAERAEELVELVLRKRKPIERRAAAQYERLYAERPGAFVRRLAAYLEHPQKKIR